MTIKVNPGDTVEDLLVTASTTGNAFLVAPGDSIQAAINGAADGDTILIQAGTYDEQINVNKELSLIGFGDGANPSTSTIIRGGGKTDVGNGSGTVISVNADNVSINGIRLQDADRGVSLGNGHADFSLTNSTIINTDIGIRTASSVHFDGITVIGSTFDGNDYGVYHANDGNGSRIQNVNFDSVDFLNNHHAAYYAETLETGSFTNITATGNAVGNANGIVFDFWTAYQSTFSDITFDAFTVDNGATSNASAAFRFATFGASTDATNITIQNGSVENVARVLRTTEPDSAFTISNLSVGTLAGQYGAPDGGMLGPNEATFEGDFGDTVISGDLFSSTDDDVIYGDFYDSFVGDDLDDFFDGHGAPTVDAGNDNIDGGGGNDTLFGGGGNDTLTGGDGDDVYHGEAGVDQGVLADNGGAAFDPVDFNFSGIVVTDGSVSGSLVGPSGTETFDGLEVLEIANTGSSTFVLFDGMSIQAAVDAAQDGDTIILNPGTYTQTSRLDVDKAVTLVGAGEGATTIVTANTSWGVYVTADNVSISELTVDAAATTLFGVKVAPDSAVPTDSLVNFTLQNVTVQGAGRSEIDLNGVDNSQLTNVTADGQNTAGVGIALSDSTGITLTDISTTGNDWGSVGLFSAGNAFDPGTNTISFDGSYSHSESVGVYADEENATVVEDIDFSALFTTVYKVENSAFRDGLDGRSDDFTFFFGDEASAVAFALSLVDGNASPVPDKSIITTDTTPEDVDAETGTTFLVKDGMSIAEAVAQAGSGDTIILSAGTFAESVTIDKPLTLLGPNDQIAGDDAGRGAEAVVQGSFTLGADGITVAGFEFANATAAITGGGPADNFSDITIGYNDFISLTTDNQTFVTNGFGTGGAPAGATNWQIMANRFDGITGDDSSAMRIDNVDGLTIAQNVIDHTESGASGRRGIQIDNSQNVTLSGNTIDLGLTDFADPFEAIDEAPYALQLSLDNDGSAQSTATVSVTGNSFKGAYDGIVTLDDRDLTDLTIDGNSFESHNYGVRFAGATGTATQGTQSDLTVENNTFDAINVSAVTFDNREPSGGPAEAFADVTVQNNTFNGTFAGVGHISNGSLVLSGTNLFEGSDGEDELLGGTGVDTMIGNGGADELDGGGDNDLLIGGLGDDTFTGGAGIDTAVVADNGGDPFDPTDFDVTAVTATAGVASGTLTGPDGTETLDGIELLKVANTGSDTFIVVPGMSIQTAIDAASPGDTIILTAGLHDADTAQIVVDKDLDLIGEGSGATIIQAAFDTGNSGDARGWFLVEDGVTLNVSDMTFDGTGAKVWQAFRHLGSGSFDAVEFKEIKFDESGPSYAGTAIAAFGSSSNVDVTDSMFSEIGRIGVLYFGADVTGTFEGNTYTGKGDGDFLDYALDISAGAEIEVIDNQVSNNRGVASSDGSASAGFLVSTFFGDGTEATFSGNTLTDNTTGIHVGFNESDSSAVTIDTGNVVSGGDTGMAVVGNAVVATPENLTGPGGTIDWDAGDGNNQILGAALGDSLSGGMGDDTLTGGPGDDTIDGGDGFDVMAFSGNRADYDVTFGSVTVTDNNPGDGNDGTDTGTNIEALQFADGRFLIVGAGGFATIQDAIDAATGGDTILVSAGTYAEQVDVDKSVTLLGEPGTELNGVSFTNLTGWDGTSPLNEFFEQNNPNYTASTGFDIQADNVVIDGFTITGFGRGVHFGSDSDGSTITSTAFTNNVTGLRKATAAEVTNFTLTNSTFANGIHGMTIYAASDGSGTFDGIAMYDNSFTAFSEKGMYFEQLSNADLQRNSFDDVGNFGRVNPPFGGTEGEFGNAIDINLKYGTYENVTFTDTEITNSGHSNQDGAAASGDFGGAIGIKTRDDAPSYNANPAAFSGQIVFQGGFIDGTSTGVRVGEPGKDNLGPDVLIDGMAIDNATVADVDNATDPANGGTTTVNLAATQAELDASVSLAPVVLNGNDLANTLIGGAAADTLSGGDGDDVYHVDGADTVTEVPGEGTDTVVTAESFTLAGPIENLTLTDAVTNAEDFEDFGLGPITDGENEWSVSGSTDQEVVTDPDDAGDQAFRISSDPSQGHFGGPYAPNLPVSAGEPQTTAGVDRMVMSFKVKAVQPGDNSRVELDFGNEANTDRVNFMVLENTAAGIRIATSEPLPDGNWDTGGDVNDFAAFTGNRTIVDGLDNTQEHDVSLLLTFVDGSDKDLIEIFVDGDKVGETTTFENYREFHLGEDHATAQENNQAATVFFRGSSGGAPNDGPGGENQGFLFDDITYSTFSSGTGASGTGNAAANVITGNSEGNALSGLGDNDTLNGGFGDDTLTGGPGDDVVAGGPGIDTMVLSGNRADYDLAFGSVTVTDLNPGDGDDGTDTATGVEILQFADTSLLIVGAGGFATIQAAIDAAGDGDTILVRPGTYLETDIIVDKPLTLIGDPGEETVPGAAANAPVIDGGGAEASGFIVADGVDDVTIQGFVIQNFAGISSDTNGMGIVAAPTSDPSNNLLFDNNSLLNNNWAGILAWSSSVVSDNVQATNNRVEVGAWSSNTNVYGIELTSVTNGTIGSNDVSGGGFIGIQVRHWTGTPGTTSDVTVSGNAVDGFIQAGISADLGPIDGLSLIDNVVTGNTTAISVQGEGSNDVSNLTMTGNTVTVSDPAPVAVPGFGLDGVAAVEIVGVGGTNDLSGNTIDVQGTATIAGFDGLRITGEGQGDVDLAGTAISNTSDSGGFDLNHEGTASDDVLADLAGDDRLSGLAGDDRLLATAGGDDVVDGGDGFDVAVIRDNGGNPLTIGDFDFSGFDASDGVDGDTIGVDGRTLTLTDIEAIEIANTGSSTLLLFDGLSLQAAIDAAADGDTILVFPGTYTEMANYNPTTGENDPNFNNPLGLLINKSVTIQGVDASGAPITDANATLATIVSQVQSNWGTNFYVTADNVTLAGLAFQAVGSSHQPFVNKAIEIVGDNFTLEDSLVDGDGTLDVYGAVYINDENVPVGTDLGTFVSAIASYSIDGNILRGSFTTTNGPGHNIDPGQIDMSVTNNLFENAPGSTVANRGIGVVGNQDGVAWRNAPAVTPEITDNTFDAALSRLFLGLDDDTANLPDRGDFEAIVANNTIASFAYPLDDVGDLRYVNDVDVDAGIDTNIVYLRTNAGEASGDAMPGDTLVALSGPAPETSTLVTDDLIVDAQPGSVDLNLELDPAVTTVTLVGDQDVDVTGNDLDNTIVGNDGDNVIDGGDGTDLVVISDNGGNPFDPTDFDFTGLSVSAGVLSGTVTGPGGTDTLAGIELLQVANTGSNTFVVIEGMSIQEAIDAASAGDTVFVAAGTYVEQVVVDKELTLLGANEGLAGNDSGRGGESDIEGSIRIAADSVTLDGLKISEGGSVQGSFAGIYVQGDNADIANIVLERSGSFDAYRGILTVTGAAGNLMVTDSYASGWATGAFINPGSDATLTGNVFENNNVGVSNDGPDASSITGNVFLNNQFEHIGIGALNNPTDAGAIVGANTFTGTVPNVGIYPLANADGQVLTGTDNADVFNGDQTATGFAQSFDGGAEDDIIRGGGGTDTLTGGTGADEFGGTASELDGDTITDLEQGDTVRLIGVTGLAATNVRISGSNLEIDDDNDGFGANDVVIALANDPNLAASVVDDNGDTLLSFLEAGAGPLNTVLMWEDPLGEVFGWTFEDDAVRGDDVTFGKPAGTFAIDQIVDLDLDGFVDLLWKDGNGNLLAWYRTGDAITDTAFLGSPADGTLNSVVDYDGNGTKDLVWEASNGNLFVWPYDGTTKQPTQFVGKALAAESLIDIVDFDGQDSLDILWQDSNGGYFAWHMDGATRVATTYFGQPAGGPALFDIVDIDNNGSLDFLWENSNGTIFAWTYNGATKGPNIWYGKPLNFDLKTVEDIDGDNQPDLIWEDGSGNLLAWPVVDGVRQTGVFIGQPAGGPYELDTIRDITGDAEPDIVWRDGQDRFLVWEAVDGLPTGNNIWLGNAGPTTAELGFYDFG